MVSTKLEVNGAVSQEGLSDVTPYELLLGQRGEYTLTTGLLKVSRETLGPGSTFNHVGGTNLVNGHFATDGTYNLRDGRLHVRLAGWVQSAVVGGAFNQSGGTLDGALVLRGGAA